MRISRSLVAALLASSVLQAAPVAAQEDYKIVDEPLTLDIFFHFRDKYVYRNDWPVEIAAAEATGIHLNGVASLATTDSHEAFNLMIASGDLPDIVGGGTLKAEFNQYGMEGAFVPLNDLIAEHAPNIKAFFDAHPDLWKAIAAPDGNVYYIPYLPDGKFGRGYFIRYDWLAKLGLEPPDNVEELHAVLTAFRDQDPNGNGKQDEIPYFNRDWEELIRLVTLWDGRSSGSDTYHDFYVEDGEVRHPYAEENYRVGMRNLAQWYAEGLIDPEIFTRGARSREVLLGNDLGGMTHDWFASTASYNAALEDEVPGLDLRAMIPPASVSGRRLEEHSRIPVKPDGWAISFTNEHPVETIKYFDFYFTDLGKRLSNFGVEGQQYDLVDGKAIYKPEVLNAKAPVNAQMWEIGAQIPRGYPQDYAYEIQWTSPEAQEGIDLYEKGDYIIDNFLGVSFNEEEKAVYDKYWNSILTYMLERQQAWILGAEDIDASWDSYLAELDNLGFGEVMEVMNSAYQRQYGASN
jgi:putative aldouronate transport system substrate-binding protein